MKDGKTKTLLIGDRTRPATTSTPRSAEIRICSPWGRRSKTTFDKESKDLRDKRLLTFDQEKVSRVELNAKKESIEFGRINQTDWQILKPKPLRADGFAVEDLVRKLKEANMDTNISEEDAKKAAAAFGDRDACRDRESHRSGRHADARSSQSEGKDKDYYAKSSVVDGVHKVSKDLGDGVDKALDDFRNKKIFDFGFSDPTKIEFKDGSEAASYREVRRQVDVGRQNDGFDQRSGADR